MQFSCFILGFQFLEKIISEDIGSKYIKSKLSEMLASEKINFEEYIIHMDSDGIVG